MNIRKLLKEMVELEASDLFCRAGGIPRLRKDGKVIPIGEDVLSLDDLMKITEDITTPQQREAFKQSMDIDFALYLEELDRRFRVSIFLQRSSPSMVIRSVRNFISSICLMRP